MSTTDTAPEVTRESLPDHASEADNRNLPINKVGIEGLSYPIEVLDKSKSTQQTVANISLSVGLPAESKGTHMSRFIEVLNTVRGEMTVKNLSNILTQIQTRLEARDAYLKAEFPYFTSKKAPASGVESLMEYQCTFEASRKGTEFDFVLGVKVPVTTLCPCSKAISEYGAHNQRSTVDVQVRATDFVWIEDIIEAVEACASAPLYALLKREDEKYVTEQAYDNPRFVEDLVREVVSTIRVMDGVTWIRTRASNEESIHNHAAFGEIEWSSSES
ncbi:MAG: GTP cyclohydrolase FolE2 [Planctomycetes bacterium]|nr:GTP cyclohydrolase FolE2 [Planctomycetota bacterium]